MVEFGSCLAAVWVFQKERFRASRRPFTPLEPGHVSTVPANGTKFENKQSVIYPLTKSEL